MYQLSPDDLANWLAYFKMKKELQDRRDKQSNSSSNWRNRGNIGG